MSIDRRSILRAVAGSALVRPSTLTATTVAKLSLRPALGSYLPLQQITLGGADVGTVVVTDGAGRPYLETKARDPLVFTAAGALGTHIARVYDAQGATLGVASFKVDCSTELHEESGRFEKLLADVVWTMMDWNKEAPVNVIRYKDRVYQLFVNWIFDHTLTMKGMKYYWPNLKDAVDFFADTQREDGMIWENCYPSTPDANYFDWKFGYDGFVRRLEGGFRQLRRAPVESHVEQFFLEALYYTWKATADDEWMKSKLNCAIKALRYATRDPYRWSEKHQLMHRGTTIDTWDYVSDDQQKFGGSVFTVELGKSEFGIFFGDNTNLIAGCRRLAEMLNRAGRTQEAPEFLTLAATLEERLDKLAWNGNFYTHWIAENQDYRPDVGVDTSQQVALSNAWSLNRGIAHEKCVGIIRTYQRIRREMPSGSPGEFYGIFPPFQKNFTANEPGLVWEYVNGGVLSIVAGELAAGAFEHGFEEYGADILRRLGAIAERYRNYLPVALRGKAADTPKRSFRTLDMRNCANTDTGAGGTGVPGWTGDPGHDLVGIPPGTREYQGVPFEVIDRVANRQRACLGLSEAAGYVASASLPVNAKAAAVYLLHAAAGPEHTVGAFTLRYADGTSFSEYVENDRNVGSWWEPRDSQYSREGPRVNDRLRVAWRQAGNGMVETGVYAAGFNNPHPEREIAALEFFAGPGDSKWMVLAATLSDSPVFFAPYDDLSTGIPDGWSAAVAYAVLEGLAGVKDQDTGFSRTLLAPRWEAAGVLRAEVTVKYPASGGYCKYRYQSDPARNRTTLQFTGNGQEFELQILLPKERKVRMARLDGRAVVPVSETVERSVYAVFKVGSSGAHILELDLS